MSGNKERNTVAARGYKNKQPPRGKNKKKPYGETNKKTPTEGQKGTKDGKNIRIGN